MALPNDFLSHDKILIQLDSLMYEHDNHMFFKAILPYLLSQGKFVQINIKKIDKYFTEVFNFYKKNYSTLFSMVEDKEIIIEDNILLITTKKSNNNVNVFLDKYEYKLLSEASVFRNDNHSKLNKNVYIYILFSNFFESRKITAIKEQFTNNKLPVHMNFYFDDGHEKLHPIDKINLINKVNSSNPVDILSQCLKNSLEVIKKNNIDVHDKKIFISIFIDEKSDQINEAINQLKPLIDIHKINLNILNLNPDKMTFNFNFNEYFIQNYKNIFDDISNMS